MMKPQSKIVVLSTAIVAGWSGVLFARPTIAQTLSSQPSSPVLIATAYTDLTLPTLRQGDRGRNVRLLQQILLDNGSLGAAAVKLGNPSGTDIDGVYGRVTALAVRDLQRWYKIPVTGRVDPRTWEVLDMEANPYRLPLPWKR